MVEKRYGWVIGLVLIAAAAAGYMLARQLRPEKLELATGTVIPVARPVAAFALTDHRGQPFANAQLTGRPHLLFFGFTHCPDVCPTTLALMAQLARQPSLAKTEMLFVTVDPMRDTQPVLEQYVNAFGDNITGLRGTDAEIDALMQSLGAARSLQPRAGEDYAVDHSATLFYIDTQGALAAVFTPPFDADKLPADLAMLIQQ
jgi:protein SCO1